MSLLAISGGVATYDGVSSQLDLPKLSTFFGKTGSLLPWWGWLLVIQAIAVAALFDYVRRNVPVAKPQTTLTPEKLAALEQKLEMVRVDGAINHSDLGKLQVEVERIDNRTLSALSAIHMRERLAELEKKMRIDIDLLSERVRNYGIHDHASWDSWESVNHHWESTLQEWLGIAKFYSNGIERTVLDVSEDEYNKHNFRTLDKLFPTADANRRYRRHRIIVTKWEELRGTVNNNVHSVAFHGLSERDVRNSNAAEPDWSHA